MDIRSTVTALAQGSAENLRERIRCAVRRTGPSREIRGASRRRPGAGTDPQAIRRMDLRLVPAALLAWTCAVAGAILETGWLAVLCGGLMVCAGLLLALPRFLRYRLLSHPRRKRRTGSLSFTATLGMACIVASGVAGHTAFAASQRDHGPIAESAADRDLVVAEVLVTATPRALSQPGGSGGQGRWAVPVKVLNMTASGQSISGEAKLLVTGPRPWGDVVPGQRLRATGRLADAKPGQPETGILTASSKPSTLATPEGAGALPEELRRGFREASGWLRPDAAGLLPGMVTGDTERLDEGLEAAMKSVGMTHLTAVSGANCSLVLGCLVLIARSLRLPRPVAAAAALAGLACFVLMVGPDASVLRAAVMGAIGLAAIASGRRGRSLGFLCLAVIGLLLADPALGTSYGFLLSVLATFGIVLLGSRMAAWLGALLPAPLAGAFAVSLSAQLLCSPAIVLLQPEFSSYAIVANIAAAPFVAPVTVLGTAAVPLLPLWPAASAALIAVSGACAECVATIARFCAALPGASLPWTEGTLGMLTMVVMSCVTFFVLWCISHPSDVFVLALGLHERTVHVLEAANRILETGSDRRRLRWPRRNRAPAPRRVRAGIGDGQSNGKLRVCRNDIRKEP